MRIFFFQHIPKHSSAHYNRKTKCRNCCSYCIYIHSFNHFLSYLIIAYLPGFVNNRHYVY
nr:MAG TPA: hypothetical protein [Caudoviricetes sp.]